MKNARIIAFAALLLSGVSLPAHARGDGLVTSYPKSLDKTCRDGRAKTYDQCSDQFAMYQEAFDAAQEQEKVLLVSLGAEWCVWCHVFARTVAWPGAPLEDFTAERFVIVHVDAEFGANHEKVLRSSAADTVYTGGLPLIFAVAADGTMAGALDHNVVADGTQYDVDALRGELSRLYLTALIPDHPYRKILRELPPIGGWPSEDSAQEPVEEKSPPPFYEDKPARN